MMTCPYCGGESVVKDIKHGKDMTVIRSYHCMDNSSHKFMSREIYEAVFSTSKHRARVFAETLRNRILRYERNREIYHNWKQGINALAERYGLSRSGVCLARREYEDALGIGRLSKNGQRNRAIIENRDHYDHTTIQASGAQSQDMA